MKIFCAERKESDVQTDFYYLPLISESGELCMQRDRELFARAKPLLRFYRFADKCVSFGRAQGISPQLAQRYKNEGFSVVKRPSGGGIVFHQSDICFTIIWTRSCANLPWKVTESYAQIHAWVQRSLKQLGIESEKTSSIANAKEKNPDAAWCFKTPVCQDILQGQRKIVGGAQWRDKNVALHQGSIQLSITDHQIQTFKQEFQKFFNVVWI